MTSNQVTDEKFRLENFPIRLVKQSDLPALEWDGEYLKYRRMFSELYRQSLAGKTLLWVIESPEGEIIGQAFVMLISSEREAADGKDRAYIFAFRVKERFRNRGIGSYLMQFTEKDLQDRGFKYVTLNVAKDNPDARRLYQRLGYEIGMRIALEHGVENGVAAG